MLLGSIWLSGNTICTPPGKGVWRQEAAPPSAPSSCSITGSSLGGLGAGVPGQLSYLWPLGPCPLSVFLHLSPHVLAEPSQTLSRLRDPQPLQGKQMTDCWMDAGGQDLGLQDRQEEDWSGALLEETTETACWWGPERWQGSRSRDMPLHPTLPGGGDWAEAGGEGDG